MRLILVSGLLAMIAAAALALSSPPGQMFPVHAIEDAPPLRGSLRISAFGDVPTEKEPTLHTSVFVNEGGGYDGMEDNDLRGHLDGTFGYGWNQVGQTHVRAGRRKVHSRYGEYELFRFLQRWTNIDLPPLTTIVEARLNLHLEHGPGFPVRVMLYEVKHDWYPGNGGSLRNNVSPPVRGEVWWNDRAYKEQSWGLPGAGYASDTDPEADTEESPLAEAWYEPGDDTIRFSSAELAAYITERLQASQPLLFMVKLTDYHEDISGSVLVVSSGDHGDSRNVVRRPHLALLWRSDAELASVEHRVFLEHGRIRDLPDFDAREASFLAATFTTDTNGVSPTLQVRGAADGPSEWKRLSTILRCQCDLLQVRAIAARDPVVVGEMFAAELMNTWVRSAPPEEQEVRWRFVSPTGFLHEVQAEYRGDYRWLVRFEPNELGIWRYRWSHQFNGSREYSAEGRFDVVIGEREALNHQLEILLREVAAADFDRDRSLQERLITRLTQLKRVVFRQDDAAISDWQLRERFRARFARLERGVLQLENPQSFSRIRGSESYQLMKEIRKGLGSPVPDTIPLVPEEPPPYVHD